ncbi:MAG: RluA family pseudouridine synthase [Oscillospiraceae bacterium]|jgi:23S rRNA pseudouridine1911/1915/1917 synthase|nr:RluA family pseudouridine synthase [Oscillospiraceae bacterium]
MHRTFTADESADGERLDVMLAGWLEQSRSHVQGLVKAGKVTVNGKTAVCSRLLRIGDTVHCIYTPPQEPSAKPEAVPLDIRYEDAHLLVVNKPQGMVVHPAPGNPNGTLVNALLHHCKGQLSGINGILRPGIVHRIDKDTSGLLAIAKTDAAHSGLAAQIAAHDFLREYRTVVHGALPPRGTIEAPIGRHQTDRKKMTVTEKNSKTAVTHYECLEQTAKFSYARVRLETGRTHQIRVHMAHIHHPVAGDPVYGAQPPAAGLAGQCLHAAVLGFRHPITQEWLQIQAELPPWFEAFLVSCRHQT